MIRVGDPIVRTRALGPDPCGVLPAPFKPTISTAAGGSLTGAQYIVQTWFTPWGETTPSIEQEVSMGSDGTLIVSNTIIPGATKMRAYFGNQMGKEFQFQELDLTTAGLLPGQTATITITNTQSAGVAVVPTKSSAYLPDSDGGFVDAGTMFSWLGQALSKMTVDLGGIRDISGVAWPQQAAWQVLANRWTEIENLWWQGWWQVVGRQAYTWLVNPITSIPGYFTQWSNAGQDIIGLWPQPGAGPVTTTLSAGIGLTDTVIPITAVTPATGQVFTMPGMIQIENELILISAQNTGGTQLLGCIRGAGGSVAAAHNSGATVSQLIAMFTGTRLPPQFLPGSSYALLQLPAGWDSPLDTYMLGKFREKEQDRQSAMQLFAEFKQQIDDLRTSRDAVPKDRQIGDARVYEAFAGYRAYFPFSILIP